MTSRYHTSTPRGQDFPCLTVGDGLQGSLTNAPVHTFENDYAPVPDTVLAAVAGDADKGLLAVEGRDWTWDDLELRVYREGKCLSWSALPVRVSSVRDFYRWFNFRHATGAGEDRETDLWEPSNNPDDESNGKSAFFIHGFNVDEEGAGEWTDTMFKRLWWSGSRAKFYGACWRGDQGLPTGFHYHENVVNAFNTASNFAQAVSALSGEKTVIAHSLGNMVVSSAIQDYGMQVDHFLMCNAAVPAEAFDGSLFDEDPANVMVHENWQALTNACWSPNFHGYFASDENDDRRLLTWQGRFADVLIRTDMHNFYSAGTVRADGDEVLEMFSRTPGVLQGITSSFGRYSWHKEETHKGLGSLDPAGTSWAGWGRRFLYNYERASITSSWSSVVGPGMEGTHNGAPNPPAIQSEFTLYPELGAHPIFLHAPDAMFASNITFTARNEILAKAIPALSPPAGCVRIMADSQNFNMNIAGRPEHNGWGRNDADYQARWLHSDMKDMAFFYTYRLFSHFISNGGL